MIYFIQSGKDGPIKIGTTKDLEQRLRSLQTSSPDRLQLLLTIPGSTKEERKIHAMFEKYRLNGEWFEPVAELIEFIKDYVPISSLTTARCRVCGSVYVTNLSETLENHKETHQAILKGGLPYPVREFLKVVGWPIAWTGKIDYYADPEDGKLAIVYSWWARARGWGLPDEDLEDYILEHLVYLDALIDKDDETADRIYEFIKQRWKKYM